jgi:hypothetical protein
VCSRAAANWKFVSRRSSRRALSTAPTCTSRNDHLEAIVHSVREASERIALHLQRACIAGVREPKPAQAFVLTRSPMGTVRAAVLEDSPLLGSAAFEDELVRMCWALLVEPS